MAAPLITTCPTWGQRDVSQRSAALFSSPEAPRRSPLRDHWAELCHVAILTAWGLGDCTSERGAVPPRTELEPPQGGRWDGVTLLGQRTRADSSHGVPRARPSDGTPAQPGLAMLPRPAGTGLVSMRSPNHSSTLFPFN